MPRVQVLVLLPGSRDTSGPERDCRLFALAKRSLRGTVGGRGGAIMRETGSDAGAVGEEEEENADEEDDEEVEDDEEDEEEEDEKAEEEGDKENIREAVEEEGWLRVVGALRLSLICVNQMLVRSVSLRRLTLIFLALK
jgi:hypothetical protein